MEADKAVGITASALFQCLCRLSEGRSESCTHIGFAHDTETPDGKKESWLIHFAIDTDGFAIDQIEPGKYPDGDILYWHESPEDAVTQAALRGDPVVPTLHDGGKV